jgi:hypothetical protein
MDSTNCSETLIEFKRTVRRHIHEMIFWESTPWEPRCPPLNESHGAATASLPLTLLRHSDVKDLLGTQWKYSGNGAGPEQAGKEGHDRFSDWRQTPEKQATPPTSCNSNISLFCSLFHTLCSSFRESWRQRLNLEMDLPRTVASDCRLCHSFAIPVCAERD